MSVSKFIRKTYIPDWTTLRKIVIINYHPGVKLEFISQDLICHNPDWVLLENSITNICLCNPSFRNEARQISLEIRCSHQGMYYLQQIASPRNRLRIEYFLVQKIHDSQQPEVMPLLQLTLASIQAMRVQRRQRRKLPQTLQVELRVPFVSPIFHTFLTGTNYPGHHVTCVCVRLWEERSEAIALGFREH